MLIVSNLLPFLIRIVEPLLKVVFVSSAVETVSEFVCTTRFPVKHLSEVYLSYCVQQFSLNNLLARELSGTRLS